VNDIREQLRSRRRRPEPEPWRFPHVSEFLACQPVLAFDATLSHTGWVLLEVRYGLVHVLDRGTINPKTTRASFLETWDKATYLRDALTGVYSAVARHGYETVVEAPYVTGGGSRTESSLIAGLMIHQSRPRVIPVSAMHVSAVLLGNSRILSENRKKAIREAIIRLIPAAAGRDWNEHQRDGASVGLTYLHDEQKRRLALAREQT
jgi:hypothetical protein